MDLGVKALAVLRSRRTRTRIARTHARVAHLRCDGLHKLSTALATTYGTVPAELRRQRPEGTRYKCQWYGSTLVVAGIPDAQHPKQMSVPRGYAFAGTGLCGLPG